MHTWFAPFDESSKGTSANDPTSTVLAQGQPSPPTPGGSSVKPGQAIGRPRITERLALVASTMSALAAIPAMAKAQAESKSGTAEAKASFAEAQDAMPTKESTQQSPRGGERPQSPLIDVLICPVCHGRHCGRGLTCTLASASTLDGSGPAVDGTTLRMQGGVLNSPNQDWKKSILTAIIAIFLYILSMWVFGTQGLRIPVRN